MAARLARRWWPRTTVPARFAGRWWARTAAFLVGLAVAVLPAAPAAAHEVGGGGATNFRTTLSAVTPAVPGISLRVVENGSRLELRNDTTTDVVVAGYAGEPYARVGPAGVYLNDNSPATFLNADRYSTTAVPASADGKGPPVWRRVTGQSVWRWHDHRVHWMLSSLPAAVAADPTAPHRISAWSVVLTYGDQRLTASGVLDWIPGSSPLPWIGLVLLVAGLVVAATRLERPHRVLAAAVARWRRAHSARSPVRPSARICCAAGARRRSAAHGGSAAWRHRRRGRDRPRSGRPHRHCRVWTVAVRQGRGPAGRPARSVGTVAGVRGRTPGPRAQRRRPRRGRRSR